MVWFTIIIIPYVFSFKKFTLADWNWKSYSIDSHGDNKNIMGEQYNSGPLAIYLAPWTGKVNQIVCCDWLPEHLKLSDVNTKYR